jgi:osmotically-inducible protein OsmY
LRAFSEGTKLAQHTVTIVRQREEDDMVAVIERKTTDLRGEVLRALTSRTDLGNVDIQAEEDNGIVTLTGTVDCLARRIEAEETARSVHGVRGVIDEIRIAHDRVYGWRDVDLLEGARQILRMHYLFAGTAGTAGTKLTVAANNGYIFLTGYVNRLSERIEAERAVAVLPDLRGVVNEIEVIPPRVGPDVLRHQAADTLGRILGGAASTIDVRVADRSVALLGTVRSWRDKVACRDAVSALHGVAEVDDLIDVEA